MNRIARLGLLACATFLGTAAATTTATTAKADQFDAIVTPGCATSIGVGPQRDAWIVGCKSNGPDGNGIFQISSSPINPGWNQQPGEATKVAVSPEGTPWVLNKGGNIFKWNGAGFTQVPGCARDIGVGPSDQAWVVGCDSTGAAGNAIYRWQGSSFVQVGGSAVDIAVSPEGTPWVVNQLGTIYKWNGTAFAPLGVPGCATDIAVGSNNDAWVIGCASLGPQGNGIYHLVGSSFVQVPGLATQITSSLLDDPWVLDAQGNIYEYSDVVHVGPLTASYTINFPSGIAAGGNSSVTINQDGSYTFQGTMHDSGFLDYNDSLVAVVKSPNGTAFTFSHSGTMKGTISSGSRDDTWSVSGTNPAIAAAWSDLSTGALEQQTQSVSLDVGDLWTSLSADIGYVSTVVSVVGSIL